MNKDIRSWSPILKDIDNIYDYYENLCNYLFSYVKPDEDLKPIGCECGFPPFIFFVRVAFYSTRLSRCHLYCQRE